MKRKCADRPVSAVGRCPKRKVSARAAGVKVSAHAAGVKCEDGTAPLKLAFGGILRDWVKNKKRTKRGFSYAGFRTRALRVANHLGISLSNLMTVMYYETFQSFDPAEDRSPRAIGLIQWTQIAVDDMNKNPDLNPDFDRNLTLDRLRRMSPRDQLDYVEEYLRLIKKRKKNDLKKIENLYAAVFRPEAVGDPNYRIPGENQAEELRVKGTNYITLDSIRSVMLRYKRIGLMPGNFHLYCKKGKIVGGRAG